jgi:predicted nucleotidyltransferase
MLDLTAGQLDLVRAILARHLARREVRAFGSRATGRARRTSDLDLVVMGAEPPPDLVLANLRADFEDSDLPFRVDLLVERDIPATWGEGFPAVLVPIAASPTTPDQKASP